MALATAMKRVTDARRKYEKELKTIGRKVRKQVAEYLAAELPEGFAIQWEQFTPYFNDGDACEFSVNSPTVFAIECENHDDCAVPDGEEHCADDCTNGVVEKRNEVEYDDPCMVEEADYTVSIYGKKDGVDKIDGLELADLKRIVAAFKKLDEKFMLAAFGDHARVVVRSNGRFSVNEYEHD